MAEKSIHIYICSDNKTILSVTHFEYLTTVNRKFAYALNIMKKKLLKQSAHHRKMRYDGNSMLAVELCKSPSMLLS